MKPLVIIPARGGSKGLPGKNIKPLNGKPLIQYTIEAAKEVFPEERICVTTDAEEIKSCVESYGLKVPFMRPAALATDQAGTHEVLLHAINFYEEKGLDFETVVLLQPTSPLRDSINIKEAIDLFSNDLDMVVSVKETDANPYYVLKEEDEEGFLIPAKKGEFTRRQDCPTVYELNGAIYVINKKSIEQQKIGEFKQVKKYVMSKIKSVDIDDIIDFRLAEILIKGYSK